MNIDTVFYGKHSKQSYNKPLFAKGSYACFFVHTLALGECTHYFGCSLDAKI